MRYKYIIFISSIVTLLVIAGFFVAKIISQPVYVGKDAELSKADSKTALEIAGVVLNMSSKSGSGVQANTKIVNYAGNYAKGMVSYSNDDPQQHFLAVKSDGQWVVVSHNSGKALNLPDIETARKYQLPKGWYNEK